MNAPADALPIHSLIEAYMYLAIAHCNACASGLLVPDESPVRCDADRQILSTQVICKACGRENSISFDTRRIGLSDTLPRDVGSMRPPDDPDAPWHINPTEDPSEIVDVAGWLTLYAVVTDDAESLGLDAQTSAERTEIRRLRMRAALCLDEALKFYDLDNELPPEDAFYDDGSRRQFREHPELFARIRIIELRAALPSHRTLNTKHTETAHTQPAKEASCKWSWWPWGKNR